MTAAFLPLALFGYTISIVLASVGVVYRSEGARRGASALFVITWFALLGEIVRLTLLNGRVPLGNVYEYLLVLSWALLTLHLYVWFRMRIYVAGMVLPPVGALAAFVSWGLFALETEPTEVQRTGWFLFHTSVSTLGMAMLGLAFAMSLLYLYQDRALKSRRTLGMLERLPALERCDQVGFHSMFIGFILLTLGIITGVVVNQEFYAKIWVTGSKQVFAMLAWLVFAAIIASRMALGFRGRKSAYLTITGFVLGLMTVIGMTL